MVKKDARNDKHKIKQLQSCDLLPILSICYLYRFISTPSLVYTTSRATISHRPGDSHRDPDSDIQLYNPDSKKSVMRIRIRKNQLSGSGFGKISCVDPDSEKNYADPDPSC